MAEKKDNLRINLTIVSMLLLGIGAGLFFYSVLIGELVVAIFGGVLMTITIGSSLAVAQERF